MSEDPTWSPALRRDSCSRDGVDGDREGRGPIGRLVYVPISVGNGAAASMQARLGSTPARRRRSGGGVLDEVEWTGAHAHAAGARAKTCEAIQGLNDEMSEVLEDFGDSPAADAVLIGAAQAVEHYEIARYGTLKTWANQLGMTEAADLLEETLQEEKQADELLTQIAESIANAKAEEGESEDDEEEGSQSSGAQGRRRPNLHRRAREPPLDLADARPRAAGGLLWRLL